jgi:hypothetical protein
MTSTLTPREERITTWNQLLEKYTWFDDHAGRRLTGKWVFRGQKDSSWGLKTTLEQAVDRFKPTRPTRIIERGLVRQFQRQLHHYKSDVPDEDHPIEWLSLMRDHGAPTRLQDWTYSFWVAAFFALETADGESAIWALNRTIIDSNVRVTLPLTYRWCFDQNGFIDSTRCFDQIFDRYPGAPMVSPVNPIRLNERLIVQQGIFLCPGDVNLSFEENLKAVLPARQEQVLHKLIIDESPRTKRDILRHLHRTNINSATLFPGLDGFARSLGTQVAFPEIIPPG